MMMSKYTIKCRKHKKKNSDFMISMESNKKDEYTSINMCLLLNSDKKIYANVILHHINKLSVIYK